MATIVIETGNPWAVDRLRAGLDRLDLDLDLDGNRHGLTAEVILDDGSTLWRTERPADPP